MESTPFKALFSKLSPLEQIQFMMGINIPLVNEVFSKIKSDPRFEDYLSNPCINSRGSFLTDFNKPIATINDNDQPANITKITVSPSIERLNMVFVVLYSGEEVVSSLALGYCGERSFESADDVVEEIFRISQYTDGK